MVSEGEGNAVPQLRRLIDRVLSRVISTGKASEEVACCQLFLTLFSEEARCQGRYTNMQYAASACDSVARASPRELGKLFNVRSGYLLGILTPGPSVESFNLGVIAGELASSSPLF